MKACGKVANPSRSKRPYLIRAMHEWMADNGHTPHIVVDASIDGVSVPSEHIKDGKIILNISESNSKSQYMRAKRKMKEILKEYKKNPVGAAAQELVVVGGLEKWVKKQIK